MTIDALKKASDPNAIKLLEEIAEDYSGFNIEEIVAGQLNNEEQLTVIATVRYGFKAEDTVRMRYNLWHDNGDTDPAWCFNGGTQAEYERSQGLLKV